MRLLATSTMLGVTEFKLLRVGAESRLVITCPVSPGSRLVMSWPVCCHQRAGTSHPDTEQHPSLSRCKERVAITWLDM